VLYLANGDDFEKSREIKISLRESSLTNLARSCEKNRIGAMAYPVPGVQNCWHTWLKALVAMGPAIWPTWVVL